MNCRLFSAAKYTFWKFSEVHLRTTTATFGFPGFKIRDKLHSRQLAQDFIFKLNNKERTILYEELQRFQTQAAAIKGLYAKILFKILVHFK